MTSQFVKVLGAGVVAMTVAAGSVLAQDAKPGVEPKAAPAKVEAAKPMESKLPTLPGQLELRKSGTVNVQRDATGKVTGMRLVVTYYEIPLDDNSKGLEALEGKKVRCTGVYSPEGGKRMFTVKSFEAMPEDGSAMAPKAADVKPADLKAPAAAEKPATK